MILVTGANSGSGYALIQKLTASGKPVRAMYRSAGDASKSQAKNTAIADFADRAALDRALEGVDAVFLICSPIPQLVDLELNVVAACRDHGIKHLVLHSALGAGVLDSSFPKWHRQVEQGLISSGVPYTILRPNTFSQNIVAFYSDSVKGQGAFYGSYGSSRISYIDVRDIAAVAAACFNSPAQIGKTHELNGPEAISCDELARKIAGIAGYEVRYVDLPESEMRKALDGMGMPAWQVQALLDLQRYYRDGIGGGDVDGLPQKISGSASITVDKYLAENRSAFLRK